MNDSLQIIRPSDLVKLTGLSRTTIWRLEKDGKLPKRKKISDRCTGWTKASIEEWIESRPNAVEPQTQSA